MNVLTPRAQEASAMLFDDAAAGAERECGRFIRAFGIQLLIADGPMQSGRAGKELNYNRVIFEAGANEQGGVRVRIELAADLRGEVPANVKKLVRIREHGWQ